MSCSNDVGWTRVLLGLRCDEKGELLVAVYSGDLSELDKASLLHLLESTARLGARIVREIDCRRELKSSL